MTPCTCHPGKTCASAASCAAARKTEFGEAVTTEQKLRDFPPLPEELFSTDGPIWPLIIKWSDADEGEKAGKAAEEIDRVLGQLMHGYAQAALSLPANEKASAEQEAVKQREQLPLVAASSPKRIWLDLGFDPGEKGGIHFSNLEGVTWSEDNATGDGIEYVRADLVAAPVSQPAPAPLPELSEADRKDAERYRFIRDYDSPSNILAICRWEEIGWDGQFVIEHDPDAAIDAALAAKKGQPT